MRLSAGGLPVPGSMSTSQLSDNRFFGYGPVSEIIVDPSGDKLVFTSQPFSVDPQPEFTTKIARQTFVRKH